MAFLMLLQFKDSFEMGVRGTAFFIVLFFRDGGGDGEERDRLLCCLSCMGMVSLFSPVLTMLSVEMVL